VISWSTTWNPCLRRYGCFGIAVGKLVLLHVIDPRKSICRAGRPTGSKGWENEGHVDCSPAEVGRLYEERFAGHLSALRSLALGQGCDYRRISTAIPYFANAGKFFGRTSR